MPVKRGSDNEPHILAPNRNDLVVATTKKRKPFITAKIHEETEEEEGVDQIDANRPSKVLILNQNKFNGISKFPCTIGEANDLLLRQLVTVKFSFNPTNRKEGEVRKDYNGNYDVLPLISADDLKVRPSVDKLGDCDSSVVSDDRQTMVERELELRELNEEEEVLRRRDQSVHVMYQKFEQRSGRHPVIGTMIVHQFITVAELPLTKGFGKLCQICHSPLRSFSTIKCVHCDFKCHAHCQNRVSRRFEG